MDLFARLDPRARSVARTHDYRCVGLEALPEGPCLFVGYHGRPALDAFLLGWLVRQQTGRQPVGIVHQALAAAPGVRRLVAGFSMVTGTPEHIAAVVARGDRLLVLPGGSRECFRSSRVRYELDWGERRGYARLALRHRLPIVPFATAGADELYRIYGDGYRISKRLTGTDLLPLCLPLGHRGLPFGPPRPVPLHQHVGHPILPPPPGPESASEAAAEALDQEVRAALRGLLRRALAAPIPPGVGLTL